MTQNAALQSLWTGTCTVFVREKQQNNTNKRMEFSESPLHENIACRLSFQTVSAAKESQNAAQVGQVIKLFLSPEYSIPPGSKITVTQNGQTNDYQNSGQPAVYSNHQEIVLDLFRGWA